MYSNAIIPPILFTRHFHLFLNSNGYSCDHGFQPNIYYKNYQLISLISKALRI